MDPRTSCRFVVHAPCPGTPARCLVAQLLMRRPVFEQVQEISGRFGRLGRRFGHAAPNSAVESSPPWRAWRSVGVTAAPSAAASRPLATPEEVLETEASHSGALAWPTLENEPVSTTRGVRRAIPEAAARSPRASTAASSRAWSPDTEVGDRTTHDGLDVAYCKPERCELGLHACRARCIRCAWCITFAWCSCVDRCGEGHSKRVKEGCVSPPYEPEDVGDRGFGDRRAPSSTPPSRAVWTRSPRRYPTRPTRTPCPRRGATAAC